MSRNNSQLNTWKIRFRVHGEVKTALVNAKDHKQAERIADSYPNVFSVLKVDYYRIQNHSLNNLIKQNAMENQFSPALAMDEFIWQKRNLRRENSIKDKQTY